MKRFNKFLIEQAYDYHIEKKIPFNDNVFRPLTDENLALFEHARAQFEAGNYVPQDPYEAELLMSDIGKIDVFEGKEVLLDFPMKIEETKKGEYNGKEVELEEPKRGGSKKFYVYVKNPKTGRVNKIEWGDTTGLKLKIADEKARKSFVARHDCKNKNDKLTAGYWACRTPWYGASLGLSPESTGRFFW